MSDYIKREDVLRILTERNAAWNAYTMVAILPPADVAAQKTGKWIEFSWTQGSTATGVTISRMYKCSVCGGLFGRKDDRFCYNCGARMVTDDV